MAQSPEEAQDPARPAPPNPGAEASRGASRDQLRVNLLFSANWLRWQMEQFLEGFGLTLQQYNALRILEISAPKPLSTYHLRQRMIDRSSDTSRLVERLSKKGLVSKQACSDDKRLVDVLITERGQAALQRIDQYRDQLAAMSANLSDEEVERLNHLLVKLRDPAAAADDR
jgi:DNA-binding MarR family transcriptional regulator